ncbi:MAG: transporter [Phycisphaerales bacterium]|nr:transporter [Phycisphaerales bacterium]
MATLRAQHRQDDLPPIRTDIPARMDALPWSGWHTYIVIALGITWVLDGLEVTLAGAVGSTLKDPGALHLTDWQVGLSATCYLAGAVAGALIFGYATDRFGRRKLFFLTLIVYVAATGATAFAWNASSYFVFRALTGAGIGGEYAAINSAIDELIPARVRGQVDLLINATFWIGAAIGAGATIYLLDSSRFPVNIGWRLAFGIGAVLGLCILFLREAVPESPRWLMTHGRKREAERIVEEVETKAHAAHGKPEGEHMITLIHPRRHTPWKQIFHSMFVEYPTRSLLGLMLMVAQAFFYNAIFFTYAIVLTKFYGVPPGRVGMYLFPFALGNVLGPMVLGRLFDVVGRRPMIVITYAASGLLLALTGFLFERGLLTAKTQTLAWSAIFFIASCAASSAYLTVSEIFPLELRAMAIAIFFALGTLVGGVGAPALFSRLIASGSRERLLWGYLLGAALMLLAAGAEAVFGVKAERRSLEEIAPPLSADGSPA